MNKRLSAHYKRRHCADEYKKGDLVKVVTAILPYQLGHHGCLGIVYQTSPTMNTVFVFFNDGARAGFTPEELVILQNRGGT